MLFVLLWVYAWSLLLGMSLLHPYMLYIPVFFLYNCAGFIACLFSGNDFFMQPFANGEPGRYSHAARLDTLICNIYFLIFMQFAVAIFLFLRGRKAIIYMRPNFSANDQELARNVGGWIFILAIIPAYYYFYSIASEAISMGGYLSYVSGEHIGTNALPVFIRISDDLFIFGYWLYLVGFPSVRKIFYSTVLFFLPFAVISVTTGSRVFLISQIMAFVLYCGFNKQIRSKYIIIIIAIAISSAVLIGLVRSTGKCEIFQSSDQFVNNHSNPVYNFLLEQGASTLTTTLTADSINNGSIAQSWMFFAAPLFNGSEDFTKYNKEHNYYLANLLSYLYLVNYNKGEGTGSSIVAEFYSINGIIGVVVLSFMFGLTILLLFHISRNSLTILLLFILMAPGFFYTARSHPLSPIIMLGKPIFLLFIMYILLTIIIKEIRVSSKSLTYKI
jgi:oligosaccharide repeat unit polymerase